MERSEKAVFVAMTKEDLEDIIEAAAEKSATVAMKKLASEMKKTELLKQDRRLHNTRLLLENYHTLKAGCAKAVYTKTARIAEIMRDLDSMEEEDGVKVDSLRKSAETTAILVEHMENMLEVYRLYCNQRQSDKDKRQYGVIYHRYLQEIKWSRKKIAAYYGVSGVTISADHREALQRLSTLFFGIDGLKNTDEDMD